MAITVLIGKKRIQDHYLISKEMFYKLLRSGAPIVKVDDLGYITTVERMAEWFDERLTDGEQVDKSLS